MKCWSHDTMLCLQQGHQKTPECNISGIRNGVHTHHIALKQFATNYWDRFICDNYINPQATSSETRLSANQALTWVQNTSSLVPPQMHKYKHRGKLVVSHDADRQLQAGTGIHSEADSGKFQKFPVWQCRMENILVSFTFAWDQATAQVSSRRSTNNCHWCNTYRILKSISCLIIAAKKRISPVKCVLHLHQTQCNNNQ